MVEPHAFKPNKHHKQCETCGGWPDADYHNLELFSDADKLRQIARGEREAEELTAKMRTPLKDISHATGILERESPLFYGTGSNPVLFT
jgi:hypothetical protein